MTNFLKILEDTIARGPYKDTWESLCEYPEPKWYKHAKLGVFIHWGLYSVPAFNNEWYSRNMYVKDTPEYEHHIKTYGNHKTFGYKDFIPLFKGEKFNASEWMSLIKSSGAQYVMPVAEHHDGFQMYGSELSDYNAVRMGPCRDVLGELKQAAEAEGIVFALSNHRAEHCWFFNGGLEFDSDIDPANEAFYGKQQAGMGSDTHDICSPPPSKEHCEDWLARLVELVEKYRPSVVYLDWWVHNLGFKPYLKKFAAYYYNRAAELGFEAAINYKHNAFPPGAAVFDVERGQLDGIRPRIWQACTATARNSWCYTEQNEYKSPEELIWNLIDVVSKNGRLLLNIGPKADGVIPERDREILTSIGKWLEQNGEGIYGASCWNVFGEDDNIRFTCKGGNLYVFVRKYPNSGEIVIKSLKKSPVTPSSGGDFHIRDITPLGTDVPLSFTRDDNALRVKTQLNSQLPVALKILIE
ncbi:MAG: alpha-L-fucosidase [Oscillospiraceae bacterium]|nr:alpha-L-fucosidase [Oscillospiraceae bacterium]